MGFSSITMWLLFFGIAAAVFAGLSRKKAADGVVLGGAVFSTIAGVAVLLSIGDCGVNWLGQTQCPTPTEDLLLTIAGGAGIAQGLVLATLLLTDPRSWIKRALFGACVPLAAGLFALTIFSIGVFLIAAWWAVLGWLIVKAPPLRARSMSDAT